MKQKVKISIRVATIGWTCGGQLHISVTVNEGSKFFMYWGDGKRDNYVGLGKPEDLCHNYFPGKAIPKDGIPFYVEISTEDENCLITQVNMRYSDMSIEEINISGCPELVDLVSYHGILDVTKNTALKYLVCKEGNLTSLDVSANTALEELYCQDNQLETLDLSSAMLTFFWRNYFAIVIAGLTRNLHSVADCGSSPQ